MGYIFLPVPSTKRTVRSEVWIRRFLYYQCTGCKRDVIGLYPVIASGSETFSDSLVSRAQSDAKSKAKKQLVRADKELYNSINIQKNFEAVTAEVVCPFCGKVQPWSNHSRLLRLVLSSFLFAIFTGILIWFFSRTESTGLYFNILATVLCCSMSIYYLRQALTLGMEKRDFQRASASPVIYFNNENIDVLKEEKYQNILRERYACRHCGTIDPPNNDGIVCTECGQEMNLPENLGKKIAAKRAEARKRLRIICIGGIVLCTGFSLYHFRIQDAAEISETSPQEMKLHHEYHGDIIVVDVYGEVFQTSDGKKETTSLYSIGAFASQGNIEFCNIVVNSNKNDSSFNKVLSYAEDSSQKIGDCVLSGYFTFKNLSPGSSMSLHRDAALENYSYLYSEDTLNADKNVILEYYCVDYRDIYIGKKEAQYEGPGVQLIILGGIFIVIGLYRVAQRYFSRRKNTSS